MWIMSNILPSLEAYPLHSLQAAVAPKLPLTISPPQMTVRIDEAATRPQFPHRVGSSDDPSAQSERFVANL